MKILLKDYMNKILLVGWHEVTERKNRSRVPQNVQNKGGFFSVWGQRLKQHGLRSPSFCSLADTEENARATPHS